MLDCLHRSYRSQIGILLVLSLSLLLTTVSRGDGPAHGASAHSRVAVVVGNGNYPGAELANAPHDAALVAASFRDLGFDVSLSNDLGRADSDRLFETLTGKFSTADVAVFYFAGHGLQLNGENYILPVDTDLRSTRSIARDAIALRDLVTLVAGSGIGTKIIILDACRNDPTRPSEPAAETTPSTGFSFVEAPGGDVMIAFSTGAGRVAFDSIGGENGPYALAFANALLVPGAEMAEVFRQVRREVRLQTAGRQIPWISSSVENALILRPGAGETHLLLSEPGEMPALDGILWLAIGTGGNPEDYRALIELFPNSPHVSEARQRLQGQTVDDAVRGEAGQVAAGASPDDPLGRSGRAPVVWGYQYTPEISDWPEALPVTGQGLDSASGRCDDAAADPTDPAKLRPGLSDPQVDVSRALVACAIELARAPGEPRLQFQLGRALDLARRHDLANVFYDLAVAQGYSAAMVARGINQRLGLGIGAPDPEGGFALQREAALRGNPRARNEVGRAFVTGEGVKRDREEGVLWVRLGASQGWPSSLDYLGYLYSTGQGVPEDDATAVSLFRRAALSGSTNAMANLGIALLAGDGVDVDTDEGLLWLDRAMAAGNGLAFARAGRFYLAGGARIAADPARAAALYEEAIQRGYAQAFLERGWARLEGRLPQGPDAKGAFSDGLFAEAAGVKGASDLIRDAAARISEADATVLRTEIERFIEQNGI